MTIVFWEELSKQVAYLNRSKRRPACSVQSRPQRPCLNAPQMKAMARPAAGSRLG